MKNQFDDYTKWEAAKFDLDKHVEDYFKINLEPEDTIENWLPRIREYPEDRIYCPSPLAEIIISNIDFELDDFREKYPEYFV